LTNLVAPGRRILKLLLTSSGLVRGSDSSGKGREKWQKSFEDFLAQNILLNASSLGAFTKIAKSDY
jgi:hypothetical protein